MNRTVKMERPTMKKNLQDYSLEKAHKLYISCPELYRHIVKLDEYIDDLEDKLNNLAIVNNLEQKEVDEVETTNDKALHKHFVSGNYRMYCEKKLSQKEAIILCKECTE